VTLHFPPLRAWPLALRLAMFGAAMLAPAILAAQAFAPASGHASALLVFVLTAAFVYPLVLFGAAFLGFAVFTASTSISVVADRRGLRAVRRLFTARLSERALPAGAALRCETHNVPRILGGSFYFRVVGLAPVAVSAEPTNDGNAVRRLVVVDGIPGEALAQAIAATLASHGGLRHGGCETGNEE
jgi:hypothetical protein